MSVRGLRLAFTRLLLRMGTVAIVLGIGVKLLFLVLKAARDLPDGDAFQMVYLLSTPMEKLPPSPDYLLCFGGVALVLIALLLRFSATIPTAITSVLGAIGRSSLFVFMLQFFIYYTFLFALRPFPYRLWPIALVASVAVIALPAMVWDTLDMNRFLSLRVWIRAARQRLQSIQSAPAS
jgi:hypothetical protein